MAKKVGVSSKISQTKSVSKSKTMDSKQVQELLIDNFVGLQKAMTNLSIKFEDLSEQIAKLLQILELSAKNFIQENETKEKEDLIQKLDDLLNQNKTIAKGLILLEERFKIQQSQPHSNTQHQSTQFPGQQVMRPGQIPSQRTIKRLPRI